MGLGNVREREALTDISFDGAAFQRAHQGSGAFFATFWRIEIIEQGWPRHIERSALGEPAGRDRIGRAGSIAI